MDVILLEKIKKLGDLGDTVKVKPGFGRNYLLPQGKALAATDSNRKVFETRKAELVKLKYFVGFTLEEAADALGISHRTAKRDWAYAKAWLFNEVSRLRAK